MAEDIRPVTAVSLKEACSRAQVSYKQALCLAKYRKIISFIYEDARWISPALDVKAAIEREKDFLDQRYLLHVEGRSYR